MSFISPVATDTNGNPKTTGSQQVLGKDDFLQLLVTKLQYQDPLKPMEDADFISQLAQFSTLEQMNNISEGIASSNQWDILQMQSMNNALAAGFIGKTVEADFSGVVIDATNKPTMAFELERDASEVRLEIRNASGDLVTTLTADNPVVGANRIVWDGTDVRGNRVDEGYYTVTATASTIDGSTFKPSLSLSGTVTAVIYRDGQARLVVDGSEIDLGDVKSVGAANKDDKG